MFLHSLVFDHLCRVATNATESTHVILSRSLRSHIQTVIHARCDRLLLELPSQCMRMPLCEVHVPIMRMVFSHCHENAHFVFLVP
jgi:DNA-binding protein Fis